MEPMQVDSRMLLQLGAVLVSLAGAWAVAKTQIKTMLEQQAKDSHELSTLNQRMDSVEANDAVFQSRINVLSEISSVSNLKSSNREIATILERLKSLELECTRLHKMHNTVHPRILSPKEDG